MFICMLILYSLRTLLALGVHIGLLDDHADEKVKYIRLSNKYVHELIFKD